MAAGRPHCRMPEKASRRYQETPGGYQMQTCRTLPSRREVLTSIAAVSAMAVTRAHGEDARWPDHPVRIIVPYPAGGSTDVLTRILAERLKDIFGQPFVIENRAGAGGNI